jgi:ribosomal protein S1
MPQQEHLERSVNNANLLGVSSYTARKLSQKQIENWSSAGAGHRDELKRIVKEIRRSLYLSKSPAKTLTAAMKKLEGLFSKREVRGEVHLLNNRHINFRLAFPTNTEDKLIFCLLYGEINTRTGAVKFELTTPVQMSLHALQRLFERLEESSEEVLLDEIYSCIGQAIPWHKGATEIEAKCWPLLSRNGFFVGTSEPNSLVTTVVTWMEAKKMGKKWGLPISNLTRLKQEKIKGLENFDFAKEFIRSFPWMLFEHVPGEDSMSLAWEQNEQEYSEHKNDPIQAIEIFHDEENIKPNLPRKISASYIAGLNYKETSPPFKTHTLHHGVVVQKREDGHLIVGLRNGWVGQIPRKSIDRGVNLIENYMPPKIGDEISVLVHKITHHSDEGAYALSLDPKDVSDANWALIEKEYPIGSSQSANLKIRFFQEFIAQLGSGIRGVIPANEVQIYLNQPALYGCSPIGQIVNTEVIGYRSEKKCLLLSIKNIASLIGTENKLHSYKPGDLIFGKCTRNVSNYALIEIIEGFFGLLHKLNNWGKELPSVGDEVQVLFIGEEKTQVLLGGIPEHPLEKTFFAYPLSAEKWDEFITQQKEGDSVEVQILFWREKAMCYMVVTSSGIVGMLPSTEINWLSQSREELKQVLKPGDIFKTMILRISKEKNRVVFSKKALDKNPIDDELTKIHLNDLFVGTIVNVLDYGCFIQLEPSGIQALLHCTKIPEGKTFFKGEICNVYIDSIDHEKKRIGVKLTYD